MTMEDKIALLLFKGETVAFLDFKVKSEVATRLDFDRWLLESSRKFSNGLGGTIEDPWPGHVIFYVQFFPNFLHKLDISRMAWRLFLILLNGVILIPYEIVANAIMNFLKELGLIGGLGEASGGEGSRKMLQNDRNLLGQEHAILVPWFSNDANCSISKRDSMQKIFSSQGRYSCFLATLLQRLTGAWRVHQRVPSGKESFSCTVLNITVSSFGGYTNNVSPKMMKLGNPMDRPLFLKGFSGSQIQSTRGFASDSGLPPHQEIGMPSLSPTMTEGNMARWLRKEGEKISPGEILCEVETDKATVEMECMNEGYLGKIIKADGSREIKVDEAIAITVEDEEDIAKFKDYSPPTSESGAPAAKAQSVPATSHPPKKETVEDQRNPSSVQVLQKTAFSRVLLQEYWLKNTMYLSQASKEQVLMDTL